MRFLFAAALALPLLVSAAEYESACRVAVLANKSNAHKKEFDGVARMLKDWTFDKFSVDEQMSEMDELNDFYAKIASYDIVITCPLVPDVFSGHAAEIRTFCEQGGVFVVTDCNYPRLYTWTDELGEGYQHWHGEGIAGWNPVVLKEVDPVPALRTFPESQVDGCILWYHLAPDPLGTKWKTYLKCGYHGQPVMIGAPIGRGEVLLTNLRVPYAQFLGNVRAKQALGRAGFEITSAAGGEMKDANGEIALSLKVADGKTVPGKGWRLELKVRADGGDESVAPYVATAEPEGPKATQPVNRLSFRLPYCNPIRGNGLVQLTLRGPDCAAVIFERRQRFADLITIRPPDYRGILSEAHRGEKLLSAVTLNPADEKVAGAKLRVRLTGPDGTPGEFIACGAFDGTNRLDVALPFPRGTTPGTWRLEAEVKNAKGKAYLQALEIPVIATNATQIVADQDHVLLRAGRPWFPMGVYGMPNEDFEEQLPATGFDLIQQMNWLNGDFALAAKHGACILWENKHRAPLNFTIFSDKFKDTLGFGMHYITDEPMDESYSFFREWADIVRAHDPNHPAFAVMLYQSSYRYQHDAFDVIGLDEYPINKEGEGDVTRVATRLDDYRRRVGDVKPVIMVLQSFGQETPELTRQMAYLAVIHGANGILWFAWNWEDGGMRTSETCRAGAAAVCKELKAIEPALTSTARPVATVTNGGKTHTAVVGDETTGCYRLTVDLTKEENVCSIEKVAKTPKSASVKKPAKKGGKKSAKKATKAVKD